MTKLSLTCVAIAGAFAIGCDSTPSEADAGVAMDAPMGCIPYVTPMLGDAGMVPAMGRCSAPDGGVAGEGPCCYQDSQADALAMPGLRLAYIDIEAPVGSPLTSTLLLSVLNDALARQTFNWLFQVEGADADGPVTLRTGFGLGPVGGPYTFPTGTGVGFDDPRYQPVEIQGTLTGEQVTSEVFAGSLVVPVLNTEATAVQLELELRNLRLIGAEFNTERSCVGFSQSRGFATGAILDGFIEVATARTGMVVSGPIMTTVCSAIAGDLSDATYCETNAQNAWVIQPDSLCTTEGCTVNTGCEEDICDTGADSTTGLPACNAWRLVARFAAQGVDIMSAP